MKNVLSNLISVSIPDADLQACRDALGILHDKLLPHLVDISPEDRRPLPKMGAKTVDFVTRTLEHMRANPQFKPVFVDLDEFARDLGGVAVLRSLQQPLRQLADLVDDSVVLSGSEAYGAALACYQSAKAAAKLGQPGAAGIAEDLASRFVGRNAKATVPPAAAGNGAAPSAPGA